MESMGIIGFIFGLLGLSYAMTAKKDIAKLRQELDAIKSSLGRADRINGTSVSE